MEDWAGDHFKSSDEANACGWLRQIFVREQDNELLLGQAVPREWLSEGQRCGIERAATYFGPLTLTFAGQAGSVIARLDGPVRNPPERIRMRFRFPGEKRIGSVTVNGKPWTKFSDDWVVLPGNIGSAEIIARPE